MAFVTREDVLSTFEGLTQNVFQECIGVDLPDFPKMAYDDAMRLYGSDKPDVRFGMEIHDLNALAKGKGFKVFDEAELVAGICVPGIADSYSRKDIDTLTEWVKRPQIGAKGLVYVKIGVDGIKSSVDKFYSADDVQSWADALGARSGDMLFILSGEVEKTRKQLGDLRLELGSRLGLRDPEVFKPLWVVDFPLLEWDENTQRFFAMHHPFTSPKKADVERMLTGDHETMKSLRADAYDLVINGVEIGGGSIRIHDRALQEKNFKLMGFTPSQVEAQFGFLLGAFEYGAPPHGGIAFGFDRLCAVMQGETSIRDFIAFPKNNQGRDTMIDAPGEIDEEQLKDLNLLLITPNKT
jgi:aspartyl-tRNA synthetase